MLEEQNMDDVMGSEELNIITAPDKALTLVADPVEEFDEQLLILIKNMFYTMKINDGIGLAAPQVGENKRLIVMMLENPLVMINPVFVTTIGEQLTEEGCLSLPTIFKTVKRFQTIRVAYQNEEGTHTELTASGLSAVCIQHEIDHLDGKLFIDLLSPIKRMMINRKLRKIKNKLGAKEDAR